MSMDTNIISNLCNISVEIFHPCGNHNGMQCLTFSKKQKPNLCTKYTILFKLLKTLYYN